MMKILISTTLEHYPDVITILSSYQYKGYTVKGKEYILEYNSNRLDFIIDLFTNDLEITSIYIRRE